ncbi:MAG: MATE family efflux transporter [Clostridiales bacterium]|jgi:putative MATE family efflux protein|nr:MATE family efflux transporter [Clostridiales bacterium]
MKMRSQPVGKLLLGMSLPAMFSMLVQALYNVVDTIFVARFAGEDGITALSAAFPMQLLVLSFAIGIGVGANVAVAKRLGEGKNAEASEVAKTGLFLALITSAVFMILGLTVVKPFIAFSVGDDASVRKMGDVYLTVVMTFSAASFVEICITKILQSTGNMKVAMISQLIGAGTNIALDPLFIFGVGFFPEMGVFGAALATVIGQAAAMTYALIVAFFKKQDVSLSLRRFRPRRHNIAAICMIGFPTTVMNSVNSFTIIILNGILKAISQSGIAILGVYFKLQSFVFMPVFGLTQGLMPILSYNYGYGDKKRFSRALKLAMLTSASIMAAGLILFQAAPGPLMKLFSAEGAFFDEGKYALRIVSISFMFAAFSIILVTLMQSLGKGISSLIMSLARQVILLVFGAVLGFTAGFNAFWFAYPVAELAVFAFFLPYTLAAVRKKFGGKAPVVEKVDLEQETNASE